MEEGERIMGMEIRPVYAGESMAWLVTSTDNAPEVWTLDKVALIRSVRPVPCWKCGYKTIQTGLFLELAGRDGYRCRIVSWSGVDKAGLLSQAFRRLLDVNWGVRPKYSKSMGCEYLAGVCPHCGAIQGDNFVYGNCQSRGGAFSDPEDRSQLAAFPLPSFVGDRPQSLDWAFGRFTLEVEPRRIVFREPLMLPGNAWPWRTRQE